MTQPGSPRRHDDRPAMPGEPLPSAIGHSGLERPIRIVVADDHLLLRKGVVSIIAAQFDMVIVGEAEDGLQAVEAFRRHRPDIMLMDLQMPELDGIEAIARIRADFPTAKIIVLTTYSRDITAARAFQAGAVGHLLKDTLRQELLSAVRTAHRGGRYVNPTTAAQIALHASDDTLTERECEVLRLAARGMSNGQIARQVMLATETVKGHMKSIFAKLRATDRTNAVTIAVKRGIIEL